MSNQQAINRKNGRRGTRGSMCPWTSTATRCTGDCGARMLVFAVRSDGDVLSTAQSDVQCRALRCDPALAAAIQNGLTQPAFQNAPHAPTETAHSDGIQHRIDSLRQFIDAHYAEPLTAVTLARQTGWTREHLSRMFRQTTGRAVCEYLRLVRIEKAASLIRQGEKIEWVALAVGFRTKSSFYRYFRQVFGTTPARIRVESATSSARPAPGIP